MTLVDTLADPLAYGFMQRGMAAALIVGVTCAVVGTFVVLKGLAFIGDAVSHAAFPGLVIAYIAGIPLYVGGAVAAVTTALAIGVVARRGRLRFDTSVGVLFAGTFALGVLLFSTIDGYVTDLLGYLLGNVLGISAGDLLQLALLGVTIVVSIQSVGIILVVAMLVTPAATAQLLSVRFGSMMVLAAAIAVVSAVVGLYISFYANLASGASIVLIETVLFAIALVAGPRSGLLARRAEVPPPGR